MIGLLAYARPASDWRETHAMLSEARVIKELADIFKQYGERFTLLRSIDQQTLSDEKSIEGFLLHLRHALRAVFQATHSGVYVVTDGKRFPFVAKLDDTWPQISDEIPLPDPVSEGQPVSSFEEWPEQAASSALFIRVDVSPTLYILVLMTDALTGKNSPLLDDDAMTLGQQIRDQLGVFVQHRFMEHQRRLQRDLLESFFKNQLKPRICWNALVGQIEGFLPNWHPLQPPGESRAQLLTGRIGDRYLVLRASHMSETRDKVPPIETMERVPGPNPVRSDRSISGLAIRMGRFPFYINPRVEYRDHYAAYLWGTEIPETELVLPICHEGTLFGVLNIENMAPKAFLPYHVEVLSELCDFLSPLLWTLLNREGRQRTKEIGAQYTMGRLLKRMSRMYKHTTGQLFFKINGSLQELAGFKHNLSDEANAVFSSLVSRIRELQDRADTFLVGVDEYINDKQVDLVHHLRRASDEFVPSDPETGPPVTFELKTLDETLLVFASEMLSEHFYNVLNNSFIAVCDAIEKKQIDKGLIRVSIEHAEMPDCRNKKTAPARIYVRVEDNGGGVNPEDYGHIMEFGFSTRSIQGGSGFGLPSAREYFQSKGGGLTTENHPGHGFTVLMYLQEYTPDYHKPPSTEFDQVEREEDAQTQDLDC